MTIAAHDLKLNEMEQALTESAQMKRVLFDCYWLVSWGHMQSQINQHVAAQEVGRSNRYIMLSRGSLVH